MTMEDMEYHLISQISEKISYDDLENVLSFVIFTYQI